MRVVSGAYAHEHAIAQALERRRKERHIIDVAHVVTYALLVAPRRVPFARAEDAIKVDEIDPLCRPIGHNRVVVPIPTCVCVSVCVCVCVRVCVCVW
jgi:hypothetical protein